jgi:hypothetical protein
MSVVVHRTVVPCERMALVPFPHTNVQLVWLSLIKIFVI